MDALSLWGCLLLGSQTGFGKVFPHNDLIFMEPMSMVTFSLDGCSKGR